MSKSLADRLQKKRFYYLLELQYLGYRFHGWAIQPNVKTVQGMLEKTLKFVLKDKGIQFKTLASGRTDAKVSANQIFVELFLSHEIDQSSFLEELNFNLPSDIKALGLEESNADFNILQHSKQKEYRYYFCFGDKPHPFAASMLAYFNFYLDVELMKKAAKVFEGKHNFLRYCTTQNNREDKDTWREIAFSFIEENKELTASFFPEESFVFKVSSAGFMRHQVRLMMGQIIRVGRGEISLEEFEEDLNNPKPEFFRYIAPAAGLMLHSVEFK